MKKSIFKIIAVFFFMGTALLNLQAQWQTEVRLTNDPELSYTSFGNARCIAANGNIIHVVWYSGDTVGVGKWDILYKRSTDQGLTWSSNVNLSNSDSVRYNPAIAISGSDVNIVWSDRRDGNSEIYYIRSTDNGITWGFNIRLTNNPSFVGLPSISASGLNLHVVWIDGRNGNNEIYYKNSTDGGNTWSADLRMTNTLGSSYSPCVAVSGSNVHVAWSDDQDGNNEIYYKLSTNNGVSWGANTRLTNNSGSSIYPSLAVSGSTVHIAWSDNKGSSNYITYYRRSTNGGVSWGTEIAVSRKNYYNVFPSLAVNASVVHIVYQNLNNHGTGYDIYYNKSINGGASWGNDVQLTNTTSSSTITSIAVSGSSIHIIFRDDRDGNSEIYYKRNLTGAAGPTGITNMNSEKSEKISLSQNYPNPFNPTTKISFTLPNGSFAKLVVYDMLGREVETLVNEELNAGTYEANWNASNFSSGMYFYKLTTGEFTQTNKMILVK